MREDQPWIELCTAAVRVGSGGNRGKISGPAAANVATSAASIITGVACYVRALYGHYFLRTLYYLYQHQHSTPTFILSSSIVLGIGNDV